MGWWDRPTGGPAVKQAPVSQKEVGKRFQSFWQSVDKREFIQPSLSSWDKADVWRNVIEELKSNDDSNREFKTQSGLNQISINSSEVEKIVPKYLAYDMYNMNYVKNSDMVISKPNAKNRWLYDFLTENVSNYYMKPVTEQNPLASFMMMKEIIKQLLILNNQENPGGQSSPDEDGQNSQLKHLLETLAQQGKGGETKIQKAVETGMEKAQEELENLDNLDNGMQAGKSSPDEMTFSDVSDLLDLQRAIGKVKISGQMIANFITTTLKMTTSYFSAHYKEHEESLFDAEEIEELENLENLLPEFQNLFLDNISTSRREYHTKFDVYADISGSMNSRMYQYDGNEDSYDNYSSSREYITGLQLTKVAAWKMHKMGFVRNVHPFNSSCNADPLTVPEFMKIQVSGGTNIDRAVDCIEKNGVNALLITDMQDSIQKYSENAYFIAILGGSFDAFRYTNVGKQYLANRQCVQYDDQTATFKVVTS